MMQRKNFLIPDRVAALAVASIFLVTGLATVSVAQAPFTVEATIDDELHQYAIVQNPVSDADADGIAYIGPGWSFNAGSSDPEPAPGTGFSTCGGGNGCILLDPGDNVRQHFQGNALLGVAQHFGFESLSVDITTSGNGLKAVVGLSQVSTGADADFHWWVPGTHGRYRFDLASWDQVNIRGGPWIVGNLGGGDDLANGFYNPSDLTTVQRESIESAGNFLNQVGFFDSPGVTIDNVVIDGTCYALGVSAICADYDSQGLAGDAGLGSPNDFYRAVINDVIGTANGGYGDAYAHDGLSVLVVPYDATAPGVTPGSVTWFVGAVDYTPSGPAPLHLVPGGGAGPNGPFRSLGISSAGLDGFLLEGLGLAGGLPAAGTGLLGDGALGGQLAQLWSIDPAFRHVGSLQGLLFTQDLGSFGPEIALGATLNVISQTGNDGIDHTYYDYDTTAHPYQPRHTDQGGSAARSDAAPQHFGFCNVAKTLAPGLAVNDVLDVVPVACTADTIIAAAGLAVDATGCNGICDFNDGWFHIIEPQHYLTPIELGDALIIQTFADDEILVLPDAEGYLNFDQTLWLQDTGSAQFTQLPICSAGELNTNTVLHSALAFSQLPEFIGDLAAFPNGPNGVILSTGNTPGVLQECDGQTITHRIPVSVARAAGFPLLDGAVAGALQQPGIVIEPAAIWSEVHYKPRIDGGPTFSGGAPMRSDRPVAEENLDACREGSTRQDGLDYCPSSAGYMSLVKNTMLDLALGNTDLSESQYGAGQLIDAAEYLLTPVVGILHGDANNYMVIDTPDAYANCPDRFPDCPISELTGDYGLIEDGAATTTANGMIEFHAMPYNNGGDATGIPDESDVTEVQFMATLDPDLIPLVSSGVPIDGAVFASLNEETFPLGEGTYVSGLGGLFDGDGAYLLQIPVADFSEIFTDMGFAPGERVTFYVYAFTNVEGKAGAFSWEKNEFHRAGIFAGANAINNVASPLQYLIPEYGVDVDVVAQQTDQDPHPQITRVAQITGTTADYAFTIENTGNGVDTYAVVFDQHIPAGWIVDPDPVAPWYDSVTLGPGEVKTFAFTLDVPEEPEDGSCGTFGMVASNDNAGDLHGLEVCPDGDVDGDGDPDSTDPCDNDENPDDFDIVNPDRDTGEDNDQDGVADACDPNPDAAFSGNYRPITFQRGHYGFGDWDDDTIGALPADRTWWELPVQGAGLDSADAGIQSAWAIGVAVFGESEIYDNLDDEGNLIVDPEVESAYLPIDPEHYRALGHITHLGTGDVLQDIPLDICDANVGTLGGGSLPIIGSDPDPYWDLGLGILGNDEPLATPLGTTTYQGCAKYVWNNLPQFVDNPTNRNHGFDSLWAAQHPGAVHVQAVVCVDTAALNGEGSDGIALDPCFPHGGYCPECDGEQEGESDLYGGSTSGYDYASDAYDLIEVLSAGLLSPTVNGLVDALGGFDEIPTPVILLNGLLDEDNDGYATVTELVMRSSPTNAHSTPYSDDDNDGLANYQDSAPMFGSRNGGCLVALDPSCAVFGDTGELTLHEYVVDIENWLGQDITLTVGSASVDIKPLYNDGDDAPYAYRFELRGARISTTMTEGSALCIGNGFPIPDVSDANGGCHDSTETLYVTVSGSGAMSQQGTTGALGQIMDGKLWFEVPADDLPSGPQYVYMWSYGNAAAGSTGEGNTAYGF